jgi:hypothetical protein
MPRPAVIRARMALLRFVAFNAIPELTSFRLVGL